MRDWVRDMSRRVEDREDGRLSWRRLYRWREGWGQVVSVGRTAKAEKLWAKSRIGDWDCNLKEWRMERGVHRCWACGAGHMDLAHCMLECREFRLGRDQVAG